jgi:uncharacterized protein
MTQAIGKSEASQFVDDRFVGLDDVFSIPFRGRTIVYIPLTKTVILTDNEEILLSGIGVRTQTDVISRLPTFPFSDSESSDENAWRPVSVTFSNTQKCTLRCRYCYADGGRLDDAVISRPVVDAALDLVIANSVDKGCNPGVNFLGEGESTADWDSFVYIIESFKKRCLAAAKTPYISLSSNGVFSSSRIEFIAANINKIVFSIDGLPEVHDKNRITASGAGSFDLVINSVRALEKYGVDYGIRCTATAEATSRLPDFVRWVGCNLQTKEIHVEPVFDNSAVAKTAESMKEPPAKFFVSRYRAARQVGAEYGIELYYSSADIDNIKSGFCGVTDAENFIVTSRGLITSCNEVLRADDPRSSTFQYGAWDEQADRFIINNEAVSKLHSVRGSGMEKCTNCFAKYNCAGDCYAKTAAQFGDVFAPSYTLRCDVTRELTRDNLVMALIKDECEDSLPNEESDLP